MTKRGYLGQVKALLAHGLVEGVLREESRALRVPSGEGPVDHLLEVRHGGRVGQLVEARVDTSPPVSHHLERHLPERERRGHH